MDAKTISIWVGMAMAVVSVWIAVDTRRIEAQTSFEHRMTVIEAGFNEQMKGYNVAIENMNEKLNRVQMQLDRLYEERRHS